jgi:hypothetical protein
MLVHYQKVHKSQGKFTVKQSKGTQAKPETAENST